MSASKTRTAARSIVLASAVLAFLGLIKTPARADDTHWIHVRVVEHGGKGENVRINVPVALLESIAPAIQDKHLMKTGKIDLGDTGMDRARLREVWSAVRKSEDGEYVTVESDDQHVRVAKQGGEILIRVSENDRGSGNVKARLPFAVVDALFSGPEDELNLVAAVKALRDAGSGELLSVEDHSSSVRVWIDESNSGGDSGRSER